MVEFVENEQKDASDLLEKWQTKNLKLLKHLQKNYAIGTLNKTKGLTCLPKVKIEGYEPFECIKRYKTRNIEFNLINL